jgi:FkbM family methyltransferase
MQTNISDEMLGFKYEYFINDQLASTSVGSNKEWEPHIYAFTKLYNSLYNIDNIIDVGANFGYHTLLFSQECNNKVFAFEPQIQNFQLLKNNIEINKIKNIIPSNYACGDNYCDVKMPIFNFPNNVMLNMGDITPNMDCDVNNFSVTKSILLDYLFSLTKIDLIKIDVQGWEEKVLIGAKNILQLHKPVLIVEFEQHQLVKTNNSCKQLFNFIRNNNYYIFYLEFDYPSDHVCVHNDKLEDFKNKFKKYIFPHTENNSINNNLFYGVSEKIKFV